LAFKGLKGKKGDRGRRNPQRGGSTRGWGILRGKKGSWPRGRYYSEGKI